MIRLLRALAIVAVTLMMAFSTSFAQNRGMGPKHHQGSMQQVIIDLPKEDLSEAEITSLMFMREEEKLARDVYLALHEKWETRVFSNIAQSEQQHTDMIKVLLDKYELDDPFVNEPGVFTNKDLAALYTKLMALGSPSLVEALTVGMTIEDLDIRDLELALETIDNVDIRTVYQNLMKGSRNHLRGFSRQLTAQGGTYEPQYISIEEYETILAGDMERGPVDQDGNPLFDVGGRGGKGQGRGGKHGPGNGACISNPSVPPIKAGNYPNPANPGTMIKFSLTAAAPTTITIYNTLGQTVRFFDLGYQQAGEHLQRWDALDSNGNPVTSGLYFYRIQAGDVSVTQRLSLVQ